MNLLAVAGLGFSYDGRVPVLHDVSLTVPPGQVVGLVGPNGSGKSTLLRVVLDLLQAQDGSIQVVGAAHDSVAARAATLFLSSNDYLPQFLTAREYLTMLAGLYGTTLDGAAAEDLFRTFSMPGRLDHLVEDFSHGMRKKTQLACALLLRRPLTVIDETLNGIDLEALWIVERELSHLRDDGRSVVLVTHDLPLLERLADRIVFLDLGRVVADAPLGALLAEHGSLEAMVSARLACEDR